MAVYIVSYDLKLGDGAHDYADLYAAFDQLDCVKALYSVYLISTSSTATQIKDYLKQYMDPKDRLWVSRVPSGYSGFIMKEAVDWLKTHPPS